MSEHNKPIHCRWCRGTHGRRYLCDAAAAALAASAERGLSGSLPTIEFDEPIQMTPDPYADLLIGQLVVKAGVMPLLGGVSHPALVFTGMDAQLRTLPQWIYVPGDDNLLRQAASLVHDMTELAITQADQVNQAGRHG